MIWGKKMVCNQPYWCACTYKNIQFFLHRGGGDNLRGGKKQQQQQQEALCLCCRNLLLLAAALLLIHCKSGSQRGDSQIKKKKKKKNKLWTQTETHQLENKLKLSGFSGFPFRILFQANMGFPS